MLGRLDTTAVKCPQCGGTGKDPQKRTRACPCCKGQKTAMKCKTVGISCHAQAQTQMYLTKRIARYLKMSRTLKLTGKGLISPPKWLPHNIHYECIMGSTFTSLLYKTL